MSENTCSRSKRASNATEKKYIVLLCLIAAVRVFVFCAAFPFFNPVDEQAHFDMLVKGSHLHVSTRYEPALKESSEFIALFGSPEYLRSPEQFPEHKVPEPLWRQPVSKVAGSVLALEDRWLSRPNFESGQMPLYYVTSGMWFALGRACGLHDLSLLYWSRFFNSVAVALIVWISHLAARLVFPAQRIMRLGVPLLLAFIPQDVFYGIDNDVMSPVSFGFAFLCLVKWWTDDEPSVTLGVLTGLALAATFLTKSSNLPLVAVGGLFAGTRMVLIARRGLLRSYAGMFSAFSLCAAAPMILWLVRSHYLFHDITAQAGQVKTLRWTLKPISHWLPHPILTATGFWTFVSGLLKTFWRGELVWNGEVMTTFLSDSFYIFSSVLLILIVVGSLLTKRWRSPVQSQSVVLGFSIVCIVACFCFLGILSTAYDFGDCFYPSPAYPYFTSGRLMAGTLVPFALVYVYGLSLPFRRMKSDWLPLTLVGAIVVLMTATEVYLTWPVFSSEYNWFHG